MPVQDLSCLVSTVRNTSGAKRVFGFLPPHGVELSNNEELSVTGNIIDAVGRGDHGNGARQRAALLNAIDAGDLEILSTPSPVIAHNDGTPRVLTIQGGVLTVEDPCWTSDDGDWP